MWDFLSNPFADNTAQDWLIAAVVFVVVIVVVRTVISIVIRRLRAIATKTETDVDDLIAQLLEETKFVFVVLVALYAGAISLTLPSEVDDLLSTILVLGFLVQGALWANGSSTICSEAGPGRNSRPTRRSPRPSAPSASSCGSRYGPPSPCSPSTT